MREAYNWNNHDITVRVNVEVTLEVTTSGYYYPEKMTGHPDTWEPGSDELEITKGAGYVEIGESIFMLSQPLTERLVIEHGDEIFEQALKDMKEIAEDDKISKGE